MLSKIKNIIFQSNNKKIRDRSRIDFNSLFDNNENAVNTYNPKFLKKIRAILRIFTILGWTGMAIPVQSIFVKLPGKLKTNFARYYWYIVGKLLGLRLHTFGKIIALDSKKGQDRPILYIANHCSWLDIVTIGGLLPGCFVAKKEVGTWPLISILCKLGRVSFVSRQRHSTAKEQIELQSRLRNNDSLILFPEGTSSDGSHLYPFMSSFFALAKPHGKNTITYKTPIIQPISITYDRLDMLPVNRFTRPIYCWYGDMELAPHLWNLSQYSDMHASVIFHDPLYPENFKTRKHLAQETWDIIAKGTVALRSNHSKDEIKKII